MPQTDDHPDRAMWSDFLLGRLADAEQEQAEQRLLQEPHLAALAEQVDADDALVDCVRRAADTPLLADPAPLRDLMDRLEHLRPAAAPETADYSATPSAADAAAVEVSFLRPAHQPDEIGRLGGFRVLRPLGAGGMGIVFEAEDPALKRRVALKVMRPALAADARHRQRFLREARAAAALRHDNIIEIYQVGDDNGVPYLAMPLLTGESLHDRLRRDPVLPPDEILRIGREVAEGLAAAHAVGLIHRDIKPANIWLEVRSDRNHADLGPGPDHMNAVTTNSRVKLLDFGLARAAEDDDGLTLSGAVVGTPGYMAPEQADGAEADERSDLFSLGCVLYRMTTGHEPFPGVTKLARLRAVTVHHPPPPHEVNPAVPTSLSELIERLLAKNPADRPASARDVAQALRGLELGETVSLSAAPRLAGTGRRRWHWVVAAAAASVLLAFAVYAGVRGWFTQGGSGRDPDNRALGEVTYQGAIDVMVWRGPDGEAERLRLSDPGALPVRPGDKFRIEARVEPAAYLYVFGINEEGSATPLYLKHPPPPGTKDAARERKQAELRLPLREKSGYLIPQGNDGMMTLLLLARPDPMPLDRDALLRLFDGLPSQRHVQNPRSAVWFENGRIVQHDDRRKRQWFEETDINDPVLRLQELLRERLQPHTAFTAAVSFAKQGK